jgi:hypothetical protein
MHRSVKDGRRQGYRVDKSDRRGSAIRRLADPKLRKRIAPEKAVTDAQNLLVLSEALVESAGRREAKAVVYHRSDPALKSRC